MSYRTRALWSRRGPAHRIIERFGGTRRLARLLGISAAAVTRWLYPRDRGGCGGLIPSSRILPLLALAECQGVVITEHDLAPVFTTGVEALL